MFQSIKNFFKPIPQIDDEITQADIVWDSIYIYEQFGRFWPKTTIELKNKNGRVIKYIYGCFTKDHYDWGFWEDDEFKNVLETDEDSLWFPTLYDTRMWALSAQKRSMHPVVEEVKILEKVFDFNDKDTSESKF